MTKPIALAFATALATTGAMAEPIASSEIRVSDGDTIVARGRAYRLVGFDTPETCNAKCAVRR